MQPNLLNIAEAPDHTSLPESMLVSQARQGDEEAVRILVQRNNRLLFRVVRSVVHDDTEAEDVVQETYTRAFAALHSFRKEAALSTWLVRIALNEAFSRQRRHRPTVELSTVETGAGFDGNRVVPFPGAPTGSDPESAAARQEIRQFLESAIDELPDLFRSVFVLREIEGLDTRQTAEYLGITEATAKTRLHRARRMLRDVIEAKHAACFSELYPFDGLRCVGMADRIVAALRTAPECA